MQKSQRGAVLLILLSLLVLGGLSFLVNQLSPAAIAAKRRQQTATALAQARDALIGHALTYRERQAFQDTNSTGNDDAALYGYLPLPDVGTSRFNAGQQNPACNTEGCAMDFINGAFPAGTDSIIGRLPWRTLGTGPLRDGDGECLWYLVSAAHKDLGIAANAVMNADTLGHIDNVTTNDSSHLRSRLTQAHERPLAMIFSPGPALDAQAQFRGPIGSDVITQCGGNYQPGNYLETNLAATILDNDSTSTSTYFTGAIATTTQANQLLAIATQGKIFQVAANLTPSCPATGDCRLVANDVGLPVTSAGLFGAIRKNKLYRDDLKEMLKRMAHCWRRSNHLAAYLNPVAIDAYTAPADKVAGRMPDAPLTCHDFPASAYGTDRDPQGYFQHYREMIFIARPEPASGTFTVNGDPTCKGVLLFSGPRQAGQQRSSAADRKTLGNYLEGDNLASLQNTGRTFVGDTLLADAPPQASGTDIVVCIPPPAADPALALSPTLTARGVDQLVAYDAATRTLTLGKANIVTGNAAIGTANAAALFGCAWLEDNATLGQGARFYFRFLFKKVGTNVGSNGFVFTLADAGVNSTAACGATGSHLGYSGNNGGNGDATAAGAQITLPKIGIEFDQSLNSGFSEDLTNPGRNDPCGTTASGCAGFGYNSHAAIVYWGHAQSNAADLVSLPANDDNVHGFPTPASTLPAARPPPTNPTHPAPGFAFTDLRGKTSRNGDSYTFHVRVELQPIRTLTATAETSHITLQTKAWILADSLTVTNQIAALRNTTRPMSLLYPGFGPSLQDSAIIYDIAVPGSSCASGSPCPTGQACGTDNACYRPALHTLQVGFSGAQRTTDQDVPITDFTATWIP